MLTTPKSMWVISSIKSNSLLSTNTGINPIIAVPLSYFSMSINRNSHLSLLWWRKLKHLKNPSLHPRLLSPKPFKSILSRESTTFSNHIPRDWLLLTMIQVKTCHTYKWIHQETMSNSCRTHLNCSLWKSSSPRVQLGRPSPLNPWTNQISCNLTPPTVKVTPALWDAESALIFRWLHHN